MKAWHLPPRLMPISRHLPICQQSCFGVSASAGGRNSRTTHPASRRAGPTPSSSKERLPNASTMIRHATPERALGERCDQPIRRGPLLPDVREDVDARLRPRDVLGQCVEHALVVYEGRSVSGVERDTQTLGERPIESFARGRYLGTEPLRSVFAGATARSEAEDRPDEGHPPRHRSNNREATPFIRERTATKRRECLARDMLCIKT
jgi:hypothetical protein